MSGELTLESPSSRRSGMCWGHHQRLSLVGRRARGQSPQDRWEGAAAGEGGRGSQEAATRKVETGGAHPCGQAGTVGACFWEPLCVAVHPPPCLKGTGLLCVHRRHPPADVRAPPVTESLPRSSAPGSVSERRAPWRPLGSPNAAPSPPDPGSPPDCGCDLQKQGPACLVSAQLLLQRTKPRGLCRELSVLGRGFRAAPGGRTQTVPLRPR